MLHVRDTSYIALSNPGTQHMRHVTECRDCSGAGGEDRYRSRYRWSSAVETPHHNRVIGVHRPRPSASPRQGQSSPLSGLSATVGSGACPLVPAAAFAHPLEAAADARVRPIFLRHI